MTYRSVLAILVLALPFIQGCGSAPPGESLKATILAANAGRYSEANAGLSSTGTGAQLAKMGERQTMWDSLTKDGAIDTVTIDREVARGEGADVSFTLIYKDGKTRSAQEKMVREGGKWKASGLILTLIPGTEDAPPVAPQAK